MSLARWPLQFFDFKACCYHCSAHITLRAIGGNYCLVVTVTGKVAKALFCPHLRLPIGREGVEVDAVKHPIGLVLCEVAFSFGEVEIGRDRYFPVPRTTVKKSEQLAIGRPRIIQLIGKFG